MQNKYNSDRYKNMPKQINDPQVDAARMSFRTLLEFYRRHLMGEVMPFWTQHCIDWDFGGILNCVRDDGEILSTDKYLWSQGRALWVFATLYNQFNHDQQWLRIAENIADFIMRSGPDTNGAWPFCLHRDGRIAIGACSVYVDAFVMYGLTAYARATENKRAIGVALEIFRRTSPLLDDHAHLPTEPHRIPKGLQAHGPLMIFANVYHELGLLTNDRLILGRALELAEKIVREHIKPPEQVLLEFVRPGGEMDESDAGQTFLPGHAIESMWFLEQIYRYHNRLGRIQLIMDVIRWHLEKGWDNEYGGIMLACHRRGGQPAWHQSDAKVWWPHTEALYALLRAYQITRESWCLEWYWRIHDYAFKKFPNREHGDWRQNLDRQGRPIAVVVKNLAVKDPFHLPRALLKSIFTLSELAHEPQP